MGLLLGGLWADGTAQFRTAAESVEVPVTVLHRRKPVAGLEAADFKVLENGQPVKVLDAWVDSQPLDITLLLDVSESTSLPWIKADAGLAAAAGAIQSLLRPDDILTTYRFAENVERVTPGLPPAIRGQTAVFDAILETLLRRPRSSRSVTIVLTDGLDTASTVPRRITQTVADRADGVIHIVALSHQSAGWYFALFGSRQMFHEFSADLRGLATTTGGRFFVVENADGFLPALGELLEQTRTRYHLRYTPSELTPGWHTIEVSTTTKEHQVTHRRGYWRAR